MRSIGYTQTGQTYMGSAQRPSVMQWTGHFKSGRHLPSAAEPPAYAVTWQQAAPGVAEVASVQQQLHAGFVLHEGGRVQAGLAELLHLQVGCWD